MRLVSGVLVGATLVALPAWGLAAGQAGPAQMGMAPLCAAKVLALSTAADAGPVAVTVDPVAAAPACVDKDGDTLKLASVELFTNGASGALAGDNKVTVSNIGPGGATFSYRVVDARGLAVRTTFTIRRP